ncbi:hypothetical protein G8759_32675 [Spirosoma aureum]|uniref:DoxX family protein n=1 Tax=Spirosoma aureum TaxID=2692134 RepID=A0A6G9AXE7_9BACT|nr:hypothetical protein [Spirosoma aureum]QIP17054.1 hypothetical protein G8759_32675 [Spirosoma aureum]
MNRLIRSGRLLYGTAIFALGLEHLITGNFPAALLPVSAELPGRLALVYTTGVALGIAGLCVVFGKKANWATLFVGALFLLLDLVTHLPRLIANPYNGGVWTTFSELIALMGGALVIAGGLLTDFTVTRRGYFTNIYMRYGSLLYALSLIIFGIQHFIYANFVATLIPSWIPGHLFWTYLIGLAFIATAASVLLKKQIPLSTTLLGIMFLLWVILLHIPRAVANWRHETEWTSSFIALAMSGIAFVLADFYRVNEVNKISATTAYKSLSNR